MKKILAIVLATVAVLSVAACDNFTNSPEQKQFKAFIAQCKATPDTVACADFRKGPQGGAESN